MLIEFYAGLTDTFWDAINLVIIINSKVFWRWRITWWWRIWASYILIQLELRVAVIYHVLLASPLSHRWLWFGLERRVAVLGGYVQRGWISTEEPWSVLRYAWLILAHWAKRREAIIVTYNPSIWLPSCALCDATETIHTLLPLLIDFHEVLVVSLLRKEVDHLVIALPRSWLAYLVIWLAVVAVYYKNDTLFLGRITATEELSEVAADQVRFSLLVNYFLEGSIPYVLLLVKDAGEQL